jgi:hypothetical protein
MGPAMLKWHSLSSVVGFKKDPLQDAIHAGIPIRSSAFDRMANSMSLPFFCLRKLVWASVTSMTGSPCCTHGCRLVLGADAMSDP